MSPGEPWNDGRRWPGVRPPENKPETNEDEGKSMNDPKNRSALPTNTTTKTTGA